MLQYSCCAQEQFCGEEISPLKQNGLIAASSHFAEKYTQLLESDIPPSRNPSVQKGAKVLNFPLLLLLLLLLLVVIAVLP